MVHDVYCVTVANDNFVDVAMLENEHVGRLRRIRRAHPAGGWSGTPIYVNEKARAFSRSLKKRVRGWAEPTR
jgi:hypothetical protein